MQKQIKIGDFVKLTGSTLKTVLYYHKVGLLPEPERSPGGYRLYGAAELGRMQSIKHLKALGLDLKQVKDILKDKANSSANDQADAQTKDRTLQEVLESLRLDLLREIKSLEERLSRVEELLSEKQGSLDEAIGEAMSFQVITGILRPEQVEDYARTNPELLAEQRKVFALLDDFAWGGEYRETLRALAEYFQEQPEHYQKALAWGVRLSNLAQMAEDDPDVENLAREATDFIKSIPRLQTLLCGGPWLKEPQAGLYKEMVAGDFMPARLKHMELFQKYLQEN